MLAKHGADGEGVATAEMMLRTAMAEDCELWLKALPESDRAKALKLIFPLVRGAVSWRAVKGLYDNGLVARHNESSCVPRFSRGGVRSA